MGRARLDKLLASQGFGSRRDVQIMIRAGRVVVNGQAIRDPGSKADLDVDRVEADGRVLKPLTGRYFMLNKPANVVSATQDNFQQTVLSLLPEQERRGIFPVGRLDKDTEGLLLLTDDGALGHALTSPRRHVDKVYQAWISGELMNDAAERFSAGITLSDGTVCLPARFEKAGVEGELVDARITVQEGRFHQVKRMVLAVGGRVERLKRLSIGPLKLDNGLAPGQYRNLTEGELQSLRECVAGTVTSGGKD